MLCAVCKKPIDGPYCIDHWGYQYCASHNALPRCYSCGRIICQAITHGGMLYRDGRQMCNLCRGTAVMTQADVLPIEAEVKQLLARVTLDLRRHSTPVRLVSVEEMAQACPTGALGLWCGGSRLESNQWVRITQEILILYGLPAEHFAAVLAHEFGHAWMWANDYPKVSRQVGEGMCELFAYIWLKQQHTRQAAFRLKQIDDRADAIYGAGFDLAHFHFKKHHLLTLLEYVKTNGQFPS